MFTKVKIGDFAKYNQISIQALRYYEKIGLLNPIYIDSMTNYRYYHIKQSAVIDNIQFFQRLDFSLEEIKHIMNDTNTLSELHSMINMKKDELNQQLFSIKQQLKDIDTFQENAFIYQEKQHYTAVELLEFPTRWVLTYPITQNIYQMTEEEYEFSLREFKSQLADISKFNRVGSIMPCSSFLDETFSSKRLFIFTNNKRKSNLELKKGLYAIYYCHSFKEEITMLKQFKKEIEQNNFQIIGDYICEVLYEKNKTSDVNRSMFIRMQIPIQSM